MVRFDRATIAVVVGSTRPRRLCRGIAEWVLATLARETSPAFALVDLADVALPLLDEPRMAALGDYAHDHTRRWSRLVSAHAGFVFVMPQYNWGYTAALKNALDYLYAEWHDKPAAMVTYGSHGGGKGADQLRSVLTALGMRLVTTNPRLDTPPDGPDGAGDAAALDLAPYATAVRTMGTQLATLVHDAERR